MKIIINVLCLLFLSQTLFALEKKETKNQIENYTPKQYDQWYVKFKDKEELELYFIFGLIGIVLIICVVIEKIENKQNNNKFEKEYYDVNNLILNKIEKNHFTICCLRDLMNDLKKHEFIYEKYNLKEEIIYNSEISIKEFKKLLKEKIRSKQNYRLESLNLK